MDKKQFLDELFEKLPEVTDWEPRYYEDGFTSENKAELEFIRGTNIFYHKKEMDRLIGDYLTLSSPRKDNIGQFCRFSCDYLYTSYEEEGWEAVWYIIDQNIKNSMQANEYGIMKLIEENKYDSLKEHLFIRPLNYQDHKYELKNYVYRQEGDIVLVLYILLSDTRAGSKHDMSSTKFPKMKVKEWEITEDEVWEAALGNTYLIAPPRMYLTPQDTYDPAYQKGAFMALGNELDKLTDQDAPILTTTSQLNGAIAYFYPGVKEKIAQMFDGDYYVVFTSIHDAHVHKKGTVSPLDLLRKLKNMNRTFDPSEVLSRKVYLYEKESGELKQLDL